MSHLGELLGVTSHPCIRMCKQDYPDSRPIVTVASSTLRYSAMQGNYDVSREPNGIFEKDGRL